MPTKTMLELGKELGIYDRVLDAIRSRCVHYGDFTLASGKKSHYYIDLRHLALDGHMGLLFGRLLDAVAYDHGAVLIGGPATGAIPLAVAASICAASLNDSLGAFYVPKEDKDHGLATKIVGPVKKGQTVLLVEDVVTTGNSLHHAWDVCHKEGLIVKAIVPVLDRLEGARERFAAMTYEPLYTLDDLKLRKTNE